MAINLRFLLDIQPPEMLFWGEISWSSLHVVIHHSRHWVLIRNGARINLYFFVFIVVIKIFIITNIHSGDIRAYLGEVEITVIIKSLSFTSKK